MVERVFCFDGGTPSPLVLRKILKTNNLICDYVLDL